MSDFYPHMKFRVESGTFTEACYSLLFKWIGAGLNTLLAEGWDGRGKPM